MNVFATVLDGVFFFCHIQIASLAVHPSIT